MRQLIQHFHQLTKADMGINPDDTTWPDNWKEVEYKNYARFPQFPLPAPRNLTTPFSDVLKSRLSSRDFAGTHAPSLSKLSDFLHWSCGINPERGTDPKSSLRYYASGGQRYPLEIYLAIQKSSEIDTGVYHYNVLNHSLERVGDAATHESTVTIPSYPSIADAPVFLFITGIFERNTRKYQDRGYRFVVAEAGSVLQQMYLVASALGLPCCSCGIPCDSFVEHLLDFDEHEQYLLPFLFADHHE